MQTGADILCLFYVYFILLFCTFEYMEEGSIYLHCKGEDEKTDNGDTSNVTYNTCDSETSVIRLHARAVSL